VIETVRADNALLGALLEGARPVALDSDELRLAFPESADFLKRKAEDPPNRRAVGRALEAVAGRSLRLAFELRPDEDTGDQAGNAVMTADELVARLVEEFDAEELVPDVDANPATAERDQ
jgi:DNA polymerase III subunit gamma/tau